MERDKIVGNTSMMEQEDMSIIESRERRVAEARKLTLFSDVFMTTALNDSLACQHVLRILTGIKDLVVKEIRTQYRIAKITSHDAILDVLAEDSNGKLYNIEIQRADTVDHARRTRFYGSMIDSEYLQKGKSYDELPDVHIIYISETDLWKARKTTYSVKKYFEGTEIAYDDGVHILYVNAAVEDGTDTAKLMKYFKTTDPEDMSQGDLSRRVHFLKREEGGYDEMCEISEKWLKEGIAIGERRGITIGKQEGITIGKQEGITIGKQEGITIGKQEGKMIQARETAYVLADMGFTEEKISQAVNVDVDVVKQWFDERVVAK